MKFSPSKITVKAASRTTAFRILGEHAKIIREAKRVKMNNKRRDAVESDLKDQCGLPPRAKVK